MAELSSARVLQSGKVYRQMFDAEVQLMKSLDTTKNKVIEQSGKDVTLPSIFGDRSKSQTSLKVGSVRSERQQTWVDGMRNDYYTENPVLHRQATAERKHRLTEPEEVSDANTVRGLPSIVENAKKNSDIIERIASKRQERHEESVDKMNTELSIISNNVEPKIVQVGEILQQQLKADEEEISAKFKTVEDDDVLIKLTHDNLLLLWDDVRRHFPLRRQLIVAAMLSLNEIEDERSSDISDLLRKFNSVMEKIAFLPISDIHRLIEKEAMMINQSTLANRRAYGSLQTNLLEKEIEKAITLHRNWDERVKDWKTLRKQSAVENFKLFMNSKSIVSPAGVDEAMQEMLETQKNLSRKRLQVMEKLKDLKPPASSKPAVYKWNTLLTKAHAEIDQHSLQFVQTLHGKYEDTCQQCLAQVETYKTELISTKACNEEETMEIVNNELLPLVGDRLKSFEAKLEKMDLKLEKLARRSEQQLRNLFKYAQGAAHLWDVHEINLAKQERKLETKLEENRQHHDIENQEKETKLDVVLDRLRQESCDENLSSCLEQCLQMLEEVKDGYNSFHLDECRTVEGYPALVMEELSRYSADVCKYFGVKEDKEEEEEEPVVAEEAVEPEEGKVASPVQSDQDATISDRALYRTEKTMQEVVLELLNTHEGKQYKVITDVLTLEEDEEEELSDNPDEEQPSYLSNIAIDNSYLLDMKKHIRLVFLNHLEEWKQKSLQNAGDTVKCRKEELHSELDLRYHLHQPRAKRMEVDIRNVRAAELVVHRDRVQRHCKGVKAALNVVRQKFHDVAKDHETLTNDFIKNVNNLEEAYVQAAKSSTLVDLNTKLHSILENYVDKVTSELHDFHQTLGETVMRLKNSNSTCINSFTLFSDGGNFSPDEVVPLKKKLEVLTAKVESTEAFIMRDFEGMEAKKVENAKEIVTKFEDRFRNHMTDLLFMEKLQRWLNQTQVKIRTEVAHSNSVAMTINRHLELLKQRIDACERPNIDKEDVTPQLLRQFVSEIIQSLQERSAYLRCKKNEEADDASKDMPADYQPPNKLGPNSFTARCFSHNSGQKSGSSGGDNTIGVIKNILRAQQGKTEDFNDTESQMSTKTARVPPSTAQSGRTNRKTGRGTLSSIAGSTPEPEHRRKSASSGRKSSAATGVYKRRETKFDPRFMIFGFETPEGSHFMAKIRIILYEVLDSMLSTAEVFYKQKGLRPSTKPDVIPETFELCAESIVDKMNNYENQCKVLLNTSLQDFRQSLRNYETTLCDVPRLLIDDCAKSELEILETKVAEHEKTYLSKESQWESQKALHKHDLRPHLGHPDQLQDMNALSEKEAARQSHHMEGIEQHANMMQDIVRQCASNFVEKMSFCTRDLMTLFDNLLTIDDVIVGQVPPKKEPLPALVRRRADGVEMEDVADPTYGMKPLCERGAKLWNGIDVKMYEMQPLEDGDPSAMIQTSNTTLPQTHVEKTRDVVLEQYREAHMKSLQRIRSQQQFRTESAQRWKQNWEQSNENVKKLYSS